MGKKKSIKKSNKSHASQLANKQSNQRQGSESKGSQLASPNKPKNKYERKQEKYLEKKQSSQRIEQIPKKVSQFELDQLKAMNSGLLSEANYRIEMIKASGYTSKAMDRVEYETGRDYFDFDDVTSREDLIKEVTRARVFINDDGSTIHGARLETAQINAAQYKGKFGNEYNNEANNFARYDTTTIDGEIARKAFENYRKIESHRVSQIMADGGYGSENLIAALYDAEIRGLDGLVYGEELLDSFVAKEADDWDRVKSDYHTSVPMNFEYNDNIRGGYLF